MGIAAEPMDVGFELASNLPREFLQWLLAADHLDAYVLDSRLNPFYLQADFNGDGWTDIAVLLREKDTDKAGILIHHGKTDDSFVIAAGQPVHTDATDRTVDDFSSLDAWHVHPKGLVQRGAHNQSDAPVLLGDALMVEKLEASSALIYWTGSTYAWYQRGD